MNTKKVLSEIFSHFPEGGLKNKIRLYLYNRPKNQEFSVSKNNKNWIAKYHGFQLTFSPESNPYHVLLSNYIFLHHVPNGPVDLLVDAGAFIGSFSIYAVNKYSQIQKIIALEPDPVNLEKLRENVTLNNLGAIQILPVGLWSKKDTLLFFPNQELASSVYNKEKNDDKGIEIPVDALDNILNGVSGKRIFIKMNIEGAELEAMRGCVKTIQNNKVHFAIAADHNVAGELTQKKVEDICRGLGMSITTFKRGQYITVYASNEVVYSNPVTI